MGFIRVHESQEKVNDGRPCEMGHNGRKRWRMEEELLINHLIFYCLFIVVVKEGFFI